MQSQAAELKQQGAEDAARDPNSKVTSEDAESKIVEETKRAGGQAYQFDPNASPEEKAAQARAHLPPGFEREKKSKAVGLVSDIDDGTPDQYDLPPPSKAGAIDLPPTANGKAAVANGRLSEDDEARWVERAGWAPRFGNGEDKDVDTSSENVGDHQTWVESKLDDKFFGDWYHNTAIIIFACLSSWVVAVLGGGIAWVFLIMGCCATYYRTSIRRVRRNFRDDVNREMAKTKLETDSETLEWINSFLVKFWPIYAPVIATTVVNSVDQILSTSTPAFLDSMRMKTFTLGSKPPRLEHVKTYPKTEDDIVLMDWKFSFTPNDVADLTARQLKNKIQPKVALEIRVGKALVSKGFDVIVEDMAFSGLMRVKVKLQIPAPHIERVDICFLERPTIDYVCKPLGGDTLGFDINFVPMLQSFIMEQIHGNLAPIMYAPNVFPIEVAKMLSGNAVDQAIGVLAITIHGAHGLKNPDKFSGSPDPYTVISLNSRDPLAKTKTVKENANPRWNETKYIIITNLTDSLTLQVYDFNEYRKDKQLGTATFTLEQLEKEAEFENLQLEVMANGKARGILQTDVRFFQVLEGRKLEDGSMEPPPESNTGIAKFTVEQAKELDGSKSFIGQLNPYGVLLLNGKEIHVTKKLKRTNQPIWADGSKEVLITDRKSARMGLVIKDDRDVAADPILGSYQIKLDDMLKLMEKGQEWYNLAGTKTGRAKLTLQWKPVALKGGVGGSGGYVTPIGVMRIHFQSAKDLRNLETMGKSDPYVRVLLSGVEKGRTVTFQNNLNPEWDEVLYVPMHSTSEKLTLEVMDQENLGKDRTLGSIEMAAADYVRQTEGGEYVPTGGRQKMSDGLRMNGRGLAKGTLNYTVSFYPTMPVVDPEEEEQEKKEAEEAKASDLPNGEKDAIDKDNERKDNAGKVDTKMASQLAEAEAEQNEQNESSQPKLRLSADDLSKYKCGLIVFKLHEAEMTHSNCALEVLMDDMLFPSFISSKGRSRRVKFDEIGDAMVRELDVSQITLRLRQKSDSKGDDKPDHTLGKMTGNTLDTLKQCLYNPTVLNLKDGEGGVSKIKVSLKFIPVSMTLDPSESVDNQGIVHVDVLDGADLPAADRNGKSDPYCKFELNGKEVYKTDKQMKTLHPAWNEFFETPVPSRIAAKFKVQVYDYDFGGSPDFLGEADINLELLDPMVAKEYKLHLDGKSGTVRLRLNFKPGYVTRSRQGTTTFQGTFAKPGKIVTGVAGAPIKGVGMVGGGVAKGASFMRHGFRGKKKGDKGEGSIGSIETTDEVAETGEPAAFNTPPRVVEPATNGDSPQTPGSTPTHNRTRSFGARSVSGATAGGAETGTATFTIVSASGYPPGTHVRVHVKQLPPPAGGAGGKSKEVHKTKALKLAAAGSSVSWGEHETFKVSCTPDTPFQLSVKDHSTFSSDDLGEGMIAVDDSGSTSEKSVSAGVGSVVVRTAFLAADQGSIRGTTPRSASGVRRSFLSKREPKERSVTPS
ncbi:MAG: hypothetical protein M4579_002007 [Chaenotheca gracillima]|nr:MAG: hypothetical protein M4579_002007 [Chaenotheca gracillima]